ncbi:MAG: hypothetical protein ACI88A_002118 [Paraglaciecola sp.]|jgi:hypothetical protein
MSGLNELEISPKKTYVSLRRKKQFALIQASTKTRVDIGINLQDEATTGRLKTAGSFNAMVLHRVRISDASEVDDELINWLRQAYNQS